MKKSTDIKAIFSAIYVGLESVKLGLQKIEREFTAEESESFYPREGTIFVKASAELGMPRPYLVEPPATRATPQPGTVAFYDREDGMGDWRNWLGDVRAGKIIILWCPVHGSVNNETYLKAWKL